MPIPTAIPLDEYTSLYQIELHDDKLAQYAETPQTEGLSLTFSLRPNWEYNGHNPDGAYMPRIEVYINGKRISGVSLGTLAFLASLSDENDEKALALAREQIALYMKRMQNPLMTLFESLFRHCDAAFSVPLDKRR